MAAFIVISSNNRLHYIVDGIEKCRPLNPSISVGISTGKIIKTDDRNFTYKYTAQEDTGNEKSKFKDLVSNQLAALRVQHNVQKNDVVNIGFLENPMTQEEYNEDEEWINEFNEIYSRSKGNDIEFCL